MTEYEITKEHTDRQVTKIIDSISAQYENEPVIKRDGAKNLSDFLSEIPRIGWEELPVDTYGLSLSDLRGLEIVQTFGITNTSDTEPENIDVHEINISDENGFYYTLALSPRQRISLNPTQIATIEPVGPRLQTTAQNGKIFGYNKAAPEKRV
jgi:hypothetical protein